MKLSKTTACISSLERKEKYKTTMANYHNIC